MKQVIKTPFLLMAVILLAASCKKTELAPAAGDAPEVRNGIGDDILNPNAFNMDQFEQNIKDAYGPGTTGFSYAISVGDQVVRHGAMGKARTIADGNINYTSNHRQELASVTKFITAIAAYRILHMKGIDDNVALVKNYLPESWTVHASYNTLTFRQLLSHKSGFPIEQRDYANLKAMVNMQQGNTAYNYNNANFALCRILLPYLLLGKNYFAAENGNDALLEQKTAEEFRKIIRQYVLQPSGLTYWDKADFKDWHHISLAANPPVRYYKFNLNDPSSANGDDFLIAGSRGLVLTTYEVAQVLTAYERGLLVTAADRTTMKTNGAGFDGAGLVGAKGTYYWKNGGGGGESLIMVFPNSMRVAVNANSRFYNNQGNIVQVVANANIMKNAYDNAWD